MRYPHSVEIVWDRKSFLFSQVVGCTATAKLHNWRDGSISFGSNTLPTQPWRDRPGRFSGHRDGLKTNVEIKTLATRV